MTTNLLTRADGRRSADRRATARNALLINGLVCPGMGSLFAGKIVSGLGQLALAATGFVLVMVWFVALMIRYYGLMFGEVRPDGGVPGWVGALGATLFAFGWLWALVTGLALVRQASRDAMRETLHGDQEQGRD